MTKKAEKLTKQYFEIVKIHVTSGMDKSTVATIYRSKFSCMEDLGAITREEKEELTRELHQMLYEWED